MEKTVRSASVLDVDLVWFFRDAEAAMGSVRQVSNDWATPVCPRRR